MYTFSLYCSWNAYASEQWVNLFTHENAVFVLNFSYFFMMEAKVDLALALAWAHCAGVHSNWWNAVISNRQNSQFSVYSISGMHKNDEVEHVVRG